MYLVLVQGITYEHVELPNTVLVQGITYEHVELPNASVARHRYLVLVQGITYDLVLVPVLVDKELQGSTYDLVLVDKGRSVSRLKRNRCYV